MLFTAIVFFVILSILVLVHELGHLIVALLCGVKVEEFGFGLPPRIWGKNIHGIVYSLNWLPIGGFVKLFGEDGEEGKKGTYIIGTRGHITKAVIESKAFFKKSKKQRAAILLAGVAMNFILACGITTYLLSQGVPEASGRVHIEKILPGSPAATAGLLENDIVVAVGDGKGVVENVAKPADLIQFTKAHAGTTITVSLRRGEVASSVSLVPRKEFPKGEGPMGVAISDQEIKKYSLTQAPVEAVKINLNRAWEMFAGLGTMVTRVVQLKPVGSDVAGPIGIAQVTGQAVKFGFSAVLEFMSILSLNLAVLNILPIPALDGGRLLFVILEKVLGRRVKPAFEHSTHQIGMIILLALVVLISINDILRLAYGG